MCDQAELSRLEEQWRKEMNLRLKQEQQSSMTQYKDKIASLEKENLLMKRKLATNQPANSAESSLPSSAAKTSRSVRETIITVDLSLSLSFSFHC